MANTAYMRSQDIFHPDKSRPVSIIGCGSIGSFSADTLAKMGFKTFHLFDMDTVEDVNIGCQRYGWEDIGKKKVEALRDILIANSPVKIEDIILHHGKITSTSTLPMIPTVVGLDNMKARQIVWHKLRNKIPILIDGRIGGQIIKVISAVQDYASVNYYEESLYNDADAVELPCTMKNVCYVANIMQGLIGRMLRNYIEKGVVEKEIGIDIESWIGYVKE